MSRSLEQHRRFVARLQDLVDREDRAALAALRRGLGKEPGGVAEMHPYVVRWLPSDEKNWEYPAYYLVAALFAWHPRNWQPDGLRRRTNLGASLAWYGESTESKGAERRFVALLNCHQDALPDHLRGIVGLLKSKDIPVDWAQLLSDIQAWGWESRTVQWEWARGFWGQTRASRDGDADGLGGAQ